MVAATPGSRRNKEPVFIVETIKRHKGDPDTASISRETISGKSSLETSAGGGKDRETERQRETEGEDARECRESPINLPIRR